ncbi:MAG: NADH-quinone oxidoreductase subunit L [Deltaproteobacteria bacterium]|nr:NADH-quinone oxidoreductase subunit L [Deltaproteobacteria bacterium]
MVLAWIILLPLLGALINGYHALSCRLRQQKVIHGMVNFVGVGLPFVAFLIALSQGIPFILGAEEPIRENLFSWISVGSLHIEAGLYLDRLSTLMVLIITGVGTLIHLYSIGYMKGDSGYAKYFAYLNLFLTSMLILVLGDNLLLLFLGWEGVGLCSYLLIGFWFEDKAKAQAGKKAFIVNRIGDVGFLLGIFALGVLLLPGAGENAVIFNFEYIESQIGLITVSKVFWLSAPFIITLFLFVGATGKSAQIPLYVWLPDAMAGPTPVSALIHAATMVTAGVYMIARMDFLFDVAPETLHIIAIIGASTALFAALIAMVQTDIKKVLAYSTVSQLGYMFLAMGVGAYAYGVFHLMTHAFFKACLFLGSGSVIHAMSGEQDIRKMGGLKKALPITSMTFLIATMTIAGLPPFAAFFSKDHILWKTYSHGHPILWVMGLLAAFGTAFYMFRLYILTFTGKSRVSEEAKAHLHESPFNMTFALIVLAVLSAVAGFLGLPEVLGGHDWIAHWLHLGSNAAEAHGASHSHTMELLLMGVSVAVATFAILLAFVLYRNGLEGPNKRARAMRPLHNLLTNKFYVDEIYDACVVRPIYYLSQSILFTVIDRKLIDEVLVNRSGRFLAWLGSCVSRIQNGFVNRYAFCFLLAFALMLGIWVFN